MTLIFLYFSATEEDYHILIPNLLLAILQAPPTGDQYTLLARAGRQVCTIRHSIPVSLSLSDTIHILCIQVQEIQLTTSLDQEGIKRALQRVLERVP